MSISTNDIADLTVTVQEGVDPTPVDPNAEFPVIAAYIRDRLGKGESLEDKAKSIGRRSAAEWWYAGDALMAIRSRTMGGKTGWTAWVLNNGLNVDTCYRALRLRMRSGNLDAVRGMTIAEAAKEWNIGKGDRDLFRRDDQAKPKKRAAKVAPPIMPTATNHENQADAQDKPAKTATPTPADDRGDTVDRLQGVLNNLMKLLNTATEGDWHRAEDRLGIVLDQIDEVTEKLGEVRKVLGKIAPLGEKPEKPKKTRRQNAEAETPEKTPRSRSKVGDDQS